MACTPMKLGQEADDAEVEEVIVVTVVGGGGGGFLGWRLKYESESLGSRVVGILVLPHRPAGLACRVGFGVAKGWISQ